ncbi:UNVERIFIED_CONTAM: hypothetical protein H355_014201 [Colinus virginianus]|nr:hypothetical protein H355_014201 [Colinus virginianus]
MGGEREWESEGEEEAAEKADAFTEDEEEGEGEEEADSGGGGVQSTTTKFTGAAGGEAAGAVVIGSLAAAAWAIRVACVGMSTRVSREPGCALDSRCDSALVLRVWTGERTEENGEDKGHRDSATTVAEDVAASSGNEQLFSLVESSCSGDFLMLAEKEEREGAHEEGGEGSEGRRQESDDESEGEDAETESQADAEETEEDDGTEGELRQGDGETGKEAFDEVEEERTPLGRSQGCAVPQRHSSCHSSSRGGPIPVGAILDNAENDTATEVAVTEKKDGKTSAEGRKKKEFSVGLPTLDETSARQPTWGRAGLAATEAGQCIKMWILMGSSELSSQYRGLSHTGAIQRSRLLVRLDHDGAGIQPGFPRMEGELTPEILAARAKLRERFGQAQQLGGKGTARRKTKKVHKSVVADDKKLQFTLKRLGVATIPGIEEVLMMQDNGKLLQFTKPQVQAAVPANTYVISGRCDERSSAFLANSMLSSLGRAAAGGAGAGGVKFDPSLITPAMLRDLQQQMSALKMSGVGASGGASGAATGSSIDAGDDKRGGGESKGEDDAVQGAPTNNRTAHGDGDLTKHGLEVIESDIDDDVPELIDNFEEVSNE